MQKQNGHHFINMKSLPYSTVAIPDQTGTKLGKYELYMATVEIVKK